MKEDLRKKYLEVRKNILKKDKKQIDNTIQRIKRKIKDNLFLEK